MTHQWDHVTTTGYYDMQMRFGADSACQNNVLRAITYYTDTCGYIVETVCQNGWCKFERLQLHLHGCRYAAGFEIRICLVDKARFVSFGRGIVVTDVGSRDQRWDSPSRENPERKTNLSTGLLRYCQRCFIEFQCQRVGILST